MASVALDWPARRRYPDSGGLRWDGKADIAVRRPSNQFQYILRSSDKQIERIQFGRNTQDMPLAAPVLTRMEATVFSTTARPFEGQSTEEFFERRIISGSEAANEQVK